MEPNKTSYEYQLFADTSPLKADADFRYIRDRVMDYDRLERHCDEVLERQDKLARQMYRRAEDMGDATREEGLGELAAGVVTTNSGELKMRSDLRFGDISPDNFRQLARVAKTSVPQNFTIGKKRFILNACSLELGEIEDCELEVRILQFRMKEIEQNILEHVPVGLDEIISKLRFLVGLMLDGVEIDTDYFAYQVEECADVLSDIRNGRGPLRSDP